MSQPILNESTTIFCRAVNKTMLWQCSGPVTLPLSSLCVSLSLTKIGVALCRSVQLANALDAEARHELLPDLGAQAVAPHHADLFYHFYFIFSNSLSPCAASPLASASVRADT